MFEPTHDTVLGKVTLLLQRFSEASTSLTLADLCQQTDLPKATIHRLLNALVEVGVLDRVGNSYQIGLRLFEFGTLASPYSVLRSIALPFLEDLLHETKATVHLALLDETEVVYIERLQGHNRDIAVPTRVGGRRPAYCTALGKALLAYAPPSVLQEVLSEKLNRRTPYTLVSRDRLLVDLSAVRQTGVAYDREEFKIGLMCVAAPILSEDGGAVAAISATGSIRRLSSMEGLPIKVRATAGAIAKAFRTGLREKGTVGNHHNARHLSLAAS